MLEYVCVPTPAFYFKSLTDFRWSEHRHNGIVVANIFDGLPRMEEGSHGRNHGLRNEIFGLQCNVCFGASNNSRAPVCGANVGLDRRAPSSRALHSRNAPPRWIWLHFPQDFRRRCGVWWEENRAWHICCFPLDIRSSWSEYFLGARKVNFSFSYRDWSDNKLSYCKMGPISVWA